MNKSEAASTHNCDTCPVSGKCADEAWRRWAKSNPIDAESIRLSIVSLISSPPWRAQITGLSDTGSRLALAFAMEIGAMLGKGYSAQDVWPLLKKEKHD